MCLPSAQALRLKLIVQNFLYFVFFTAALRTWGGEPFPNQACLCVVMQRLQKKEIQYPSCSILSSLWSAWPPSVLSDCWLTNVSSLIYTATYSSNSFVIKNDSKSWSLWSNNALTALYSVSDKFKEPFSVVLTLKTKNNSKHCTYISLAPKTKE